MPADGLTKGSHSARAVLGGFLTRGYWRLVHDSQFTSAKKRRAQGAQLLINNSEFQNWSSGLKNSIQLFEELD